jgi:MFS family permease
VTSEPGARPGQALELPGLAAAWGDARFREFCLYTVVIAAVMSQLVVSLSVHCVSVVGLSESQVGRLFMINGLTVAVLQTAVSRGLRGKRLTLALVAGCLFYAAGYGSVGFARTFAAMGGAVLVVTLGEAFLTPALYAIAANLAPSDRRGRYAGAHGFCYQLGSALGPLLGGLALQHLTPRLPAAPWLLVSAAAVTAAGGFSRFARLLNDEEQGLEAPLGAATLEAS